MGTIYHINGKFGLQILATIFLNAELKISFIHVMSFHFLKHWISAHVVNVPS